MLEKIFNNYSEDHILRTVLSNQNMFFANSFLIGLEDALNNLKIVDYKAYRDFIEHKLKASYNKTFDMHSLLSSLCELSIINSFIVKSDNKNSFQYEPKLRDDNNKNVEFSVEIDNIQYNVEVKSANFENYRKKLNKLVKSKESVLRYESRMLKLTDREMKENMTSTDSKVKDFLVDSSMKFPMKLYDCNKKRINVLFICWNDHTDQPCTALKHPIHGLLTKNSWHTESDFSNIDLIFITDLYQNILAHMLSRDIPLSSFLTGVPYFERNSTNLFRQKSLNPFYLPFSRNVLIEPSTSIEKSDIFPLPIAFSDQYVQVINGKYVSKNCCEIKATFK
ncbi:hypothetical protein [Wukongibacter baidiensis]